jgi:lysine-N-methylase
MTMKRPRLAAHVRARRHRVDGDELVSLHDERSGRVASMGLREWELLAEADGTRDVTGILAAATRRARGASPEHLSAFLGQLEDADMLVDGVSLPPAAPSVAPLEGRVESLPEFELVCDGSGTCCRLYSTVVFSPTEASRAALTVDGATFTPERGSEKVPWMGRAVSTVDGACAYLDADRRCRLHSAAGPAGKPHGCRRFPVQLVSDGERVLATVAPECACVFGSLDRADASSTAALALEVDPSDHVAVVPERVRMSTHETIGRAAYLRYAADQARRFDTHSGDAACWLWAEAEQLGGGAACEPDAACLAPTLEMAAAGLRRRLGQAAWRHRDDLARRLPRWLLAVVERARAADGLPLEPRVGDRRERLYVRALLFGHAFALGSEPLEPELRRSAFVLWLARALAAAHERGDLPEPLTGDPATNEPIALVAAFVRAYGIGGPGPSDSAPSNPAPSNPAPSNPAPSNPAPSNPVPSDPAGSG